MREAYLKERNKINFTNQMDNIEGTIRSLVESIENIATPLELGTSTRARVQHVVLWNGAARGDL